MTDKWELCQYNGGYLYFYYPGKTAVKTDVFNFVVNRGVEKSKKEKIPLLSMTTPYAFL